MENQEIEQSEPMRNLLDKFKQRAAEAGEEANTEAAVDDKTENKAVDKQSAKKAEESAKKPPKSETKSDSDVDGEQSNSEDESNASEQAEQSGNGDKSEKDEKSEKTTSAVDKLEKSLRESQKWGHSLSQKLRAFENKISAYVQEGALTDTEAQELLQYIVQEQPPESATQQTYDSNNPLAYYENVFFSEIENMRKYVSDDMLDDKIKALDHFVKFANEDELNYFLDQLSEINDPVQLTKKMLAVGADYYEDVYKDLNETGGVKALKLKFQDQLDQKEKKISKLEKEIEKLKENSDYIGGNKYVLPAGSSSPSDHSARDTSMSGIFNRSRQGKILR
ncbi:MULTISPECIES: hypothetical protein [Cysteiniphilum]|uniref:hypothetical protein n=1 Tax=Cysteiniphilum TaxID=2056696 RepID=UPI0017851F10|nr:MULTISPECIES: hypothetical protein [Cysteiniphilum]